MKRSKLGIFYSNIQGLKEVLHLGWTFSAKDSFFFNSGVYFINKKAASSLIIRELHDLV